MQLYFVNDNAKNNSDEKITRSNSINMEQCLVQKKMKKIPEQKSINKELI